MSTSYVTVLPLDQTPRKYAERFEMGERIIEVVPKNVFCCKTIYVPRNTTDKELAQLGIDRDYPRIAWIDPIKKLNRSLNQKSVQLGLF
ncbi:MAG: hypothetical protein ABJO02_03390 [Reichenbachiella sp.]|uniref:hypothetical protein n=1 Tax=Reichenbachiella sp. TaxID=2184521 RepID=UPI0032969C05